MSQTPPAPAADVPYEDLEALAAGEIDPGAAAAVRARIEQEPEVAAAFGRVQALEARLRGESLLAAPLGLTGRVLDAVIPGRRARPWQTLARVAAAVLVFVGSWFAFSGTAPALAEVQETPALVARARELVPLDLLSSKLTASTAPAVTATHQAPAMLALIVGVLFFAGGIALLLHWHRHAGTGHAS